MSEAVVPNSGGVAVVFGIDTEPDNQWRDHRTGTNQNIQHLPRLEELFAELGVVATYLLTYGVVSDDRAVETLKAIQATRGCEIGAHLHVWDNPPFMRDGLDREFPAFGHDLPLALFHDKLAALSERIAPVFGPPRSYRAGRFGFCAEHIGPLESLGYRVDSSVTPLIDRRGKKGIPLERGGRGGRDYRRAPLDPYHPDLGDELRSGSARLLEAPLTVGVRRPAGGLWLAAHRTGPSLVQRALRKFGLVEVVSASPVHFSAEQMKAMLQTALIHGRRLVNFTFHSSETMPGGSPSIKDRQDLDRLFGRIREVVTWLKGETEPRFMGLGSVADWWLATPKRPTARVGLGVLAAVGERA